MILITRGGTNGDTLQGVPLSNFISCNADIGSDETWVAYWDGSEVRKMKAKHTITEIQMMVTEARHGSKVDF